MKLLKLLTILTMFSTNAHATTGISNLKVAATPTVIAIIDPQLILTESKAAKSIKEQIEKKRTEYQNQISLQEKELNKKKQDLENLQGKISEAELTKKAQAFNGEVAKVQRNVQDKRMQMDQSYANAVNEIEKVISDIMKKLSIERGYDAVIPSTGLMYVNDKVMNITSEIMKLLDEQLPKVTVVIK